MEVSLYETLEGQVALVTGATRGIGKRIADGLYYLVRYRVSPVRTVRLLGASIPLFLSFYFGTVAVLYDLVWSVQLWSGGIISAGLVELLVSYVAIPSQRFDTTKLGEERKEKTVNNKLLAVNNIYTRFWRDNRGDRGKVAGKSLTDKVCTFFR